MDRRFYYVMAAQFFSALADNALLIVAIGLLTSLAAPAWMTPALKVFFVLFYVILAPFVGPFADGRSKGKVMFITNGIKFFGAALLIFAATPHFALLAYAIVGLGAAAYSPAKYGIVTEILPPEKLVIANAWIEGLMVFAIISGTVLGGVLLRDSLSQWLNHFFVGVFELDNVYKIALALISTGYLVAAFFNQFVMNTKVAKPNQSMKVQKVISEFWFAQKTLWQDTLGKISLAMTTLFWGVGATLQFIVLKWADHSLHLALSDAAILQAVVAIGVAIGAMLAANRVSLDDAPTVLKYSVLLGLMVMLMTVYRYDFVPNQFHTIRFGYGSVSVSLFLLIPIFYMILVGAVAGYFVVPMNALLQHRGATLLSSGSSISVQNFNEHLSILLMLAVYALLISLGLSIHKIIVLFGITVIILSLAIMYWHWHSHSHSSSRGRSQ